MDDKKRSAILIGTLEDICIKFPEIRVSIENKLREICSRENLPYDQVIFCLVSSLIAAFVFAIWMGCSFFAFHLRRSLEACALPFLFEQARN